MFDAVGVDKQALHKALRQYGTSGIDWPSSDKRDEMRAEWSPDNPTRNYCYVVSQFVATFMTPGRRVESYELKVPGDLAPHWFLKCDGEIVDLTADQFGDEYSDKVDYSKAEEKAFWRNQRRAVKLKKLYDEALRGQAARA